MIPHSKKSDRINSHHSRIHLFFKNEDFQSLIYRIDNLLNNFFNNFKYLGGKLKRQSQNKIYQIKKEHLPKKAHFEKVEKNQDDITSKMIHKVQYISKKELNSFKQNLDKQFDRESVQHKAISHSLKGTFYVDENCDLQYRADDPHEHLSKSKIVKRFEKNVLLLCNPRWKKRILTSTEALLANTLLFESFKIHQPTINKASQENNKIHKTASYQKISWPPDSELRGEKSEKISVDQYHKAMRCIPKIPHDLDESSKIKALKTLRANLEKSIETENLNPDFAAKVFDFCLKKVDPDLVQSIPPLKVNPKHNKKI